MTEQSIEALVKRAVVAGLSGYENTIGLEALPMVTQDVVQAICAALTTAPGGCIHCKGTREVECEHPDGSHFKDDCPYCAAPAKPMELGTLLLSAATCLKYHGDGSADCVTVENLCRNYIRMLEPAPAREAPSADVAALREREADWVGSLVNDIEQQMRDYPASGYVTIPSDTALCLRDFLALPSTGRGQEGGWVIELAASSPAAPQYWCNGSLWMGDHTQAIRFARKTDAERIAAFMLDGMNIRICEHMWDAALSSGKPQGER